MLHVWLDKTCVILAPPYLTPKKMIFGSMLFTQTVRSVHVEEWTTFTPSFSVFRVIHCKTVCLVINSLTPLLSKSVWQSRSGSHSYHPTLQRRQQRQKGKEDGWGWAGGRTTVVVGVSFDGGGGGPLQHLHIFKSEDEYRAWGKQRQANGRAASLLRAEKKPPTSQQLPGRDTGKWCGNREAPRAERSEGSHL